jgi:hypothetical protein
MEDVRTKGVMRISVQVPFAIKLMLEDALFHAGQREKTFLQSISYDGYRGYPQVRR